MGLAVVGVDNFGDELYRETEPILGINAYKDYKSGKKLGIEANFSGPVLYPDEAVKFIKGYQDAYTLMVHGTLEENPVLFPGDLGYNREGKV